MSVLKIIERDLTIAYKVAYTRIPGSDHTCALFLSQVAYWCGNSEDGWAWLTHDSLEKQIGMGRKSQDRAASFWCSVGVLQKTLRGLPAKIHYSVDFAQLEALLVATKVVRLGQATLPEVDKHSIGDSLEIHLAPKWQRPEKATESQAEAPTPLVAAPALRSDATRISEQQTPSPRSARPPSPKAEASAQAIAVYEAYPKKIQRGAALPKIELAIKDYGFDQLLEATKAYAAATRTWSEKDQTFIPHPSTWYHQQGYRDDQREWTRKSVVPVINLQPGARFGSFGHRE